MDTLSLAAAVEEFACVTQSATEADLAKPWVWGSYDSEGVRFAMFHTLEELRALAVQIVTERQARGCGPSAAQRILAQYHIADQEMHSELLGLSAQDMERAPAEGEWNIHQALTHITISQVHFYIAIRYALDGHRSGDGRPAELPDEVWEAPIGQDPQTFNAIFTGPFTDLVSFQRLFHERILQEFSTITESELELPARYWEHEALSIRFRLGRFESHARQHTVQIDKILAGIGQAPTEARRILRLIYSALGEAEGASIGDASSGAAAIQQLAQTVSARSDEIARILETGSGA